MSKDPVCIRKNKHCTDGYCEICNPGVKAVPTNEGSSGLALVVFLFIVLIAIALWFQS